MPEIPPCPGELPSDMQSPINQIAEAWARSRDRPVPTDDQLVIWDRLIEDWIADPTLPLFVRRFNAAFPRGSRQTHSSGRIIVPTDNTPAHWAFAAACAGSIDSVEQIRQLLAEHKIPVAMMLNASEKVTAEFRGVGRQGLVNDKGWKLCHIASVKVGRGDVLQMSATNLAEQFRRFLSPRNMFLIPLRIGGLGEVEEMIEAIRRFGPSQ